MFNVIVLFIHSLYELFRRHIIVFNRVSSRRVLKIDFTEGDRYGDGAILCFVLFESFGVK